MAAVVAQRLEELDLAPFEPFAVVDSWDFVDVEASQLMEELDALDVQVVASSPFVGVAENLVASSSAEDLQAAVAGSFLAEHLA